MIPSFHCSFTSLLHSLPTSLPHRRDAGPLAAHGCLRRFCPASTSHSLSCTTIRAITIRKASIASRTSPLPHRLPFSLTMLVHPTTFNLPTELASRLRRCSSSSQPFNPSRSRFWRTTAASHPAICLIVSPILPLTPHFALRCDRSRCAEKLQVEGSSCPTSPS